MAAGRDPRTPVLVAVNVSLPSERIIHGTLASLAFLVETIGDDDPTLLLIGESVAASTSPMTASRVAHQDPGRPLNTCS